MFFFVVSARNKFIEFVLPLKKECVEKVEGMVAVLNMHNCSRLVKQMPYLPLCANACGHAYIGQMGLWLNVCLREHWLPKGSTLQLCQCGVHIQLRSSL